jgi:hypothetical protein
MTSWWNAEAYPVPHALTVDHRAADGTRERALLEEIGALRREVYRLRARVEALDAVRLKWARSVWDR